jgi:hypothetical protein
MVLSGDIDHHHDIDIDINAINLSVGAAFGGRKRTDDPVQPGAAPTPHGRTMES